MDNEKIKETLNKIAVEVVRHTKAIDKLTLDVRDLKDANSRMVDNQDKMIAILQRLDQERVFTYEAVKRLERDVERNRKAIDKIKIALKI